MQYLLSVYLAWLFTAECFAFVFRKLSLSTLTLLQCRKMIRPLWKLCSICCKIFEVCDHFTTLPSKWLTYVVIMESSLHILFFIIQNGKIVKASKIFEIIAKQNYSFKILFHVFLELQGINTVVRYALFLLFYMKAKTQSTLIITSEKLVVFNEDFCNCDHCQLSTCRLWVCPFSFVAWGVLCLIWKVLWNVIL